MRHCTGNIKGESNMGLRLTSKEFENVSKRAPSAKDGLGAAVATAKTLNSAGAISTQGLTAGGAAAALEKLGVQQTEEASQADLKDYGAASGAALGAKQASQQATEQADSLDLEARSAKLDEESNSLKLKLSQTERHLASSLWDDQSKFERDEIGRVSFNERQLADYAILQAKSQDEFDTWSQNMGTLHQNKLSILQTAHAKILQELEQAFLRGEQEDNQSTQRALSIAKSLMEQKIAKARAKAQETAAWISAAISVVGAAASVAVAAVTGGAAAPVAAVAVANAANDVSKI